MSLRALKRLKKKAGQTEEIPAVEKKKENSDDDPEIEEQGAKFAQFSYKNKLDQKFNNSIKIALLQNITCWPFVTARTTHLPVANRSSLAGLITNFFTSFWFCFMLV